MALVLLKMYRRDGAIDYRFIPEDQAEHIMREYGAVECDCRIIGFKED